MEWVLFVFSPAITCLVHSPSSARGIQQKCLVFLMVGMVWGQKLTKIDYAGNIGIE